MYKAGGVRNVEVELVVTGGGELTPETCKQKYKSPFIYHTQK